MFAVSSGSVSFAFAVRDEGMYTPDQISRLRSRGLGRKRSMASREFALGIEALERFVRREPLYRVHEAVFAVLAWFFITRRWRAAFA